MPGLPRLPQPPAAHPAPAQENNPAQRTGGPPFRPPAAPRQGPLPGTAAQDPGQWFVPPRVPTAAAPQVDLAGEITLLLTATNAPFVLSGRNEYLIGREDPEDGIMPDLDLTLSGGEEAGVSRRHAHLLYRDGRYLLEDLDSLNYTYLNGVRLEPHRPQLLRDGDEIACAKLRMRFFQGRRGGDWR